MRKLKIMFILFSLFIVSAFLYLQHPQFGKAPFGDRLEKMKASPNYKHGAFVNRTFTPDLSEGFSMPGILYNFIFNQSKRAQPIRSIPSITTNIKQLPADEDWLIWFGHSSYLIQTDGIRILVDPVFSGNASPIPGTTRAFKGTNGYQTEDLPDIDYLIISHDHYDHLDYQTIKKLRGSVKKVICGLGVGSHFEYWGYSPDSIIELDWDSKLELDKGLTIYGLTARHFSGRMLKRSNTLWLSYLLETPSRKIYIGGDSGYDNYFKEIGSTHGPIDLALLDNGQYNKGWVETHMHPKQVVQAARDLNAKRLMPVHSSKFSLAMHDWDDPLKTLSGINELYNISLVTPMIGELVNLNDSTQVFSEWWRDVQ